MAMQTGKVFDGLKAGYMRYGILLILFFATVMNYVDRTIFNVLAPFIRTEMNWTNIDMANVLNAFKYGGVLGLFVAGPLIDKFGARWGFFWAVVLWTIGGAATGLASGIVAFMVFRFILGLGESANWPAATKAISEWFPAKERGVAMGFFNGGVSVGSMLAGPIIFLLVWVVAMAVGGSFETVQEGTEKAVANMTPDWLWRAPFGMVLVIGAVWLYYWMKYYFRPEEHPRVSKAEVELIQADRIQAKKKALITSVLGKPTFWGLFIARGLTSTVWFFVTDWLFLYLTDTYGIAFGTVALLSIVPFVFNDIANVFGGYLSGKLIAKGWDPVRARIAIMGLGACLMGTCFSANYARHWIVAVFVITLLLFFWGLWVSNMLALVADSFPSSEVGTVMSWTGVAQYGGAIIFTNYIGWASSPEGFNSYVPVFIAASILPVVGFLFTLALNRPSMVKKANA